MSPNKQTGFKVELFAVQRELAPPTDDLPDGIWETHSKLHGSEFEADAYVAGQRAEASYVDTDDNVFRVVRILGEVVSVTEPPKDDE